MHGFTGYVRTPMVPVCTQTHCWWLSQVPVSNWADVSVPSHHVLMISFPYLHVVKKKSTLKIYMGARPPHHLQQQTDFLFPFLVTGLSLHLHYYRTGSNEGSLFRMLFTVHQVRGQLCKGVLSTFRICMLVLLSPAVIRCIE